MAKVIAKLHANGNFETFVPVKQNKNLYKIINSLPGYVFSANGNILPQAQEARYSEFIPLIPGERYTFQAWWDKPELIPINEYGSWSLGYCYDSNFSPLFMAFEFDSTYNPAIREYHHVTGVFPDNVAYIRLSANLMENQNGRIQFERGLATPYGLALSDEMGVDSIEGFSFSENQIVVPDIVELPPVGYRNYFIEKTSLSGWVDVTNGALHSADDYDRTSDYIPMPSGGGDITIRVRYKNLQTGSRAWVCGYYFNAQRQFISTPLDVYSVPEGATGTHNYQYTFSVPSNVAFMLFSFNLYDHPNIEVKVSVERKSGATSTVKHYLAPEDMSNWVRDTGHPISIFPEGVVIKGNLIQSST